MPIEPARKRAAAKTRKTGLTTADAVVAATSVVPEEGSLDDLREAARGCRACPLWENATQTVRRRVSDLAVVFVGEQPGNEDSPADPSSGRPAQDSGPAMTEAGMTARTPTSERGEAFQMGTRENAGCQRPN
jgi:DNA polymerase